MLNKLTVIDSDAIHHRRQTCIGGSNFTAVVPMVKVVTTVFSTKLLPFHWRSSSLMLDSNALLESSEVVLALITSVSWNLKSIEFIIRVLSWLVLIVGDTRVVVKV